MKKNRRDFLKISALTGLGISGGISFPSGAATPADHTMQSAGTLLKKTPPMIYNMSGYAAPKLDPVRAGFIGLGQRGPSHVVHFSKLEGTEIKGLCDIRPEKVDATLKKIEGRGHNPALYSGEENAWKKMCDRDDIDLIYIATPWHLHAPMAIYAMKQGKHVAMEVPGVLAMDDCWEIVETSEKNKKHCIYLENCCYDFFEMLTLNMSRQDYFGEVVHVEGAYIHTLLELNFRQNGYYDMWRLKQNANGSGNLYPGHGLGPIAQVLNINRGDKMEYLVSMSGDDFSMGPEAKERAAEDSFYKPFTGKTYRGNMNTTVIRTNKGKTIMLQHDVSSPRVYSRLHLLSGTKGAAQKYPLPGKISKGHEGWLSDEEMAAVEEKYQPEIIKKIGELAKQVGGHGGMDFVMNWRLVDCLRNGLAPDIDVYDAAAWSSIISLTKKSVANRSSAVDIPDFTNGAWKKNIPVDISLEKGANTGVRL